MTARVETGDARAHWEGEPIRVWQKLWSVPVLEAWGSLGSTNDRARALAAGGALPFTTVLADRQTAGRGRGGRAWSSPAGLGLWMSVVLRPGLAEERLLVPLLAGVAVGRAVESRVEGVQARLKWPNDVLLGDRKVCGILCEASEDAMVVGIGVNVAQRPRDFPADVRPRAVSLEMASGRGVSRAALAGRILRELRDLAGGGGPIPALVGPLGEEVGRRDALRGRRVRVEVPSGAVGTAAGIDSSGALLLDTGGGDVVRVTAGSVRPV